MGKLLSNIERKTWHKYVKKFEIHIYGFMYIYIHIIYIYIYDLCICDANINMEKPNNHIKCNRYNHEEAINRYILPERTRLMKCTHYLEDVLLILT